MNQYRYVDELPSELASGRPLALDDIVELSDEDVLIDENARLIDSERLLVIVKPTKKRTSRTSKSTEEN